MRWVVATGAGEKALRFLHLNHVVEEELLAELPFRERGRIAGRKQRCRVRQAERDFDLDLKRIEQPQRGHKYRRRAEKRRRGGAGSGHQIPETWQLRPLRRCRRHKHDRNRPRVLALVPGRPTRLGDLLFGGGGGLLRAFVRCAVALGALAARYDDEQAREEDAGVANVLCPHETLRRGHFFAAAASAAKS